MAEKIAFEYKSNGFSLNMSLKYLSRPYCLNFAKDLIKCADRVTNLENNHIKNMWFGMTAKRIAVEIWFHALVYYIGKPLAKISSAFKKEIWEHANPIDVNRGDKRVAYFYAAWFAGTTIKKEYK